MLWSETPCGAGREFLYNSQRQRLDAVEVCHRQAHNADLQIDFFPNYFTLESKETL